MVWIQIIGDLIQFIPLCLQRIIQRHIKQSSTTAVLERLFNIILTNNCVWVLAYLLTYVCTSCNEFIKGELQDIFEKKFI
jgi:hypothetical protein